MERILNEREYTIPALHDYKKYGYTDEPLVGQKEWYKDYMTKSIKTDEGYIGLDEIVYTQTPPAESDFEYSEVIDYHNEPKNIIEEFTQLFSNLGKVITNSY